MNSQRQWRKNKEVTKLLRFLILIIEDINKKSRPEIIIFTSTQASSVPMLWMITEIINQDINQKAFSLRDCFKRLPLLAARRRRSAKGNFSNIFCSIFRMTLTPRKGGEKRKQHKAETICIIFHYEILFSSSCLLSLCLSLCPSDIALNLQTSFIIETQDKVVCDVCAFP